jgi:hypothetical protein
MEYDRFVYRSRVEQQQSSDCGSVFVPFDFNQY